MDFVFMLTRGDRTVSDGPGVLAQLRGLGVRHIGFKDVGIEPAAAHALHRAIKQLGATSYLEVVSTTPEACLQSARLARDLGIDRLLGGTQVEAMLALLAGTQVRYLPFPGRPFGHPTELAGSPEAIAADCRRFAALGAAGVDLLAYRSVDADPIELVRAARAATPGTLLVAGGVVTTDQIRALAAAGADAFTVGSAAFDGAFVPGGSLRDQLTAILDAAGADGSTEGAATFDLGSASSTNRDGGAALDRDPIALLLAGRYPDPETGALLAAESRSVVIERSLAGHEADLVAALGTGPRIAVVSDRQTHAVLGARIEHALARFAVQSIVLDAPRADEATAARVLAGLSPTDLVIAVGSGTLNDLTKLVALRHGCPQAVFATAPSMNGYTSLSASITSDGIKRSVRTHTPLGVFFDLEILAAAPARLIRAGLGDSACRSTAQADWLLQHLLLDRPYREAPFALLAADERDLFSDTRALLAGDLEAMRHLVRILVLSGFGMTLCNGSYPASQGEHLISHYIEMMPPPGAPLSFHGEQVSVATAAMAALQRRILDGDRPIVHAPRITRDDVIAHFGPDIGAGCWVELEGKLVDPELINARLVDWDAIRTRIGSIMLPDVRGSLAAAGAPVDPAELGWSAELFGAAMRHAREIRNRYTFLDLAIDSSA